MGKYLYIAPFENNQVVMPEDLDLTYLTGKRVTRPQRDAIYEERDILDEDGEVVGTETVFVNWGDEYTETIEERKGGINLVVPHYQGQDIQALVLVHTSPETKDILDADWSYLCELDAVDNEVKKGKYKEAKLSKTKAKKVKVKLAKHFKNEKMLSKVELATTEAEVAELVLEELGVDWTPELG